MRAARAVDKDRSDQAGKRRHGWVGWGSATTLGAGLAVATVLATNGAALPVQATSYQVPLAVAGTAPQTAQVATMGTSEAAQQLTMTGLTAAGAAPVAVGSQLATAVSGTLLDVAATAAPSSPLVVLGLGDSVASGAACDCTSFITTAGGSIAAAQHRGVSVKNLAVGGCTSSDVLAQLNSTSLRRQIAASDVVIIEIGANDFDEDQAYRQACTDDGATTCYGSTLRSTTQRVSSIVASVRKLQTKPAAAVFVLGYWNVFRDGWVGQGEGATYVNATDALTRAFNDRMESVATAGGATYVDVYSPFKGDGGQDPTRYLADDGDHPNAAGHALLARVVTRAASGAV